MIKAKAIFGRRHWIDELFLLNKTKWANHKGNSNLVDRPLQSNWPLNSNEVQFYWQISSSKVQLWIPNVELIKSHLYHLTRFQKKGWIRSKVPQLSKQSRKSTPNRRVWSTSSQKVWIGLMRNNIRDQNLRLNIEFQNSTQQGFHAPIKIDLLIKTDRSSPMVHQADLNPYNSTKSIN